MRQRLIFVLILAILICVAAPIASAAEAEDIVKGEIRSRVKIVIDGEKFDSDKQAFITAGTTYVPLDEISECLGGSYSWDADTDTATVTVGDEEFTVERNSLYFPVKGRAISANKIYVGSDGVLMVPVRAICKVFGAAVAWDGETGTVIITRGGDPLLSGDDFYDQDDLYWLSRIIHAEASGECLEGKIAVGNVVMNRVASDLFPSTIYKAIFDRNGGIQFSPAYSGGIYVKPGEESVIAAKLVLEGVVVTDRALYFTPSRNASSSWAGRNRPYDTQIGGHTFFA